MTVSHRGKPVKAFWLFNDLPLNTARQLDRPFMVKGWVYLTGMRVVNRKGQTEFVIVSTYQADSQSMQVYARRWTIKCLRCAAAVQGNQVGRLPHRGHSPDRSEKAGETLCRGSYRLLVSLSDGQYQNEQKPIRVLAHKRRAQSLFRCGLNTLFVPILFDYQLVEVFINLLSST